MTDDRPPGRDEKKTVALDPRTISEQNATWPAAIAMLERVGQDAVFAQRLGMITLLQNCLRRMAERDCPTEAVNEAQLLLDRLRRMPWDG